MPTPESRQKHRRSSPMVRAGFTLIELMVVIGIILLIAVMTASAISLTINGDKVRGGARQIQSFLAGARDRAIYSKAPRGVRFLLDPTNNRTVSSMVYIKPTDDWVQGTIEVEYYNGFVRAIRGFDTSITASGFGFPTDWPNLVDQGLLKNGVRIKIPNDNTGEWYTVSDVSMVKSGGPGGDPVLILATNYSKPATLSDTTQFKPAFQPSDGQSTYLIELPPGVMPNQEPVLLPKGSVIHLDRCTSPGTSTGPGVPGLEMQAVGDPNNTSTWSRADKLPSNWRKSSTISDPSGFDYSATMDVMFSPRGTVIGAAAQNGIIHFYVADQKDADLDKQYWSNPPGGYPTASAPEYGFWTNSMSLNYERGDKSIVTLFTRTGAVSVHPVHSNADPFKFSETGEVAGK